MKAKTVRTKVVGTRLTDAEYQRVVAAAASQEMSESDWVRALIQNATSPNPTLQVLIEEMLAVRQILQNVIAYNVEERLITKEALKSCCADADRLKRDKARALFAFFEQGKEIITHAAK
jgi:hypothetical protein